MNNSAIQLKIKERLNKRASNDFDNLQCWNIVEAFNKGMTEWCRRNAHGTNAYREGDEQSTSRIDDLQHILTTTNLKMVNRQIFFESVQELPADYMRHKRIQVMATSECCDEPRRMKTYLAEDANVDLLLENKNMQPNFEWGETFAVYFGNKLRVYTNGAFVVSGDVTFNYYRQPRKIQIAGCTDPYTGLLPTVDVECEFNDDLIEVFVDEATKILAGDIESWGQFERQAKNVEGNN